MHTNSALTKTCMQSRKCLSVLVMRRLGYEVATWEQLSLRTETQVSTSKMVHGRCRRCW